MKRNQGAALAAVILFAATPLAAVAQADPAATPPIDKKAAAPSSRVDPNSIVCKTEDVTGSRLGAKKVCLTRQQWADMAQDARQRLDRSQSTQIAH